MACRLATLQLRGLSTSSHLLGNLLTKNVEQSPTKRMFDILGQDILIFILETTALVQIVTSEILVNTFSILYVKWT